VLGCHELKADDLVVFEDQKIKWDVFKGKFFRDKSWYLDMDDRCQETMMQKRKNAQIWNLIGPQVCEYYSKNEGIDIKFEKASLKSKQEFAQNVQYILILDRSGSMIQPDPAN
jgi:hypothetical protein